MMTPLQRLRILVRGQVQGVGFRPFVWSRATALGLAGWVRNDAQGVTIEVQGEAALVRAFVDCFEEQAPPLAVVEGLESAPATVVEEELGFRIVHSDSKGARTVPAPPDTAPCEACLSELADESDRRHGYPFINCTNCGPRFTIIEAIPYDRPSTTMKSFRMCSACQLEYDDPANRRFHAQPNACPACGPRVWLVDDAAHITPHPPAEAVGDAVARFREVIESGRIVAVKGVGGFHLACDASNPAAVGRLRERKQRGGKPLAVMVPGCDQAAAFAEVGDSERRLLESQARPIVLLRKKPAPEQEALQRGVAPGNDFVGVVLPYSPLHALLAAACPTLVMTSGNLSEEPIARTNQEAAARLSGVADAFLLHDREIHSVCDDSVVRRVGRRLLPIRRSRGYAPAPIALRDDGPTVLAVGGELKAAFCVAKGRHAYVSQHIGDVGNLETLQTLRRTVDAFLRLYDVRLDAIAADRHPDYLSTRWAREFAAERGLPLVPVQHHHAHAEALAAEAHWDPKRPLLVACFDGTGFGEDGAIWGGEFLRLSGGVAQRAAHLRYFPLPGGDASIKRPYRAALSLLRASNAAWDESLACVAGCPAAERGVLQTQLERNVNCVSTSSMGRLFDAVASIVGVRHAVEYEAQAAMELETLAADAIDSAEAGAYAFGVSLDATPRIDFRPVISAVLDDVRAGAPREAIAARFHHAVADLVAAVASGYPGAAVGLTGGVFQNALLTELVEQRCRAEGIEVVTHTAVPPNDGGLSLGQAVAARRLLTVGGRSEG